MINAYAAEKPRGPLKPFEYNPGPLGPEDVEINVEYCGICHSDLSMLDNEWQASSYPLVPGHEIIGVVGAMGQSVKNLRMGQRVGLGWFSSSCLHCSQCLAGDHNLCAGAQATIMGRHGGFADKVRAHWLWAVPLPKTLDAAKAGPLFCGGLTVFNPFLQLGIRPLDRVGIIGIGGLGHLALQFARAWGCEVTAFSSTQSKEAEARSFGAHHFISSGELGKVSGQFDFILSTVSADLDWSAYLTALAPKGRLHFVGVPASPISTHAFPLIGGQKSLSGSPLGSPGNASKMLDFAARHSILPTVEMFKLAAVNEALDHLRSGQARYRVVLEQ